jgi:hypothetical protein
MTDVILHPAVERFRGAMGRMVFKKYKDRTIVCRKADGGGTQSQAQMNHQDRFKQAITYGKLALANPTTRALYAQAAKEKDVPIFSVCVADFFNAPTINVINTSDYHGQGGDPINIITSDDVGVVNVRVTITDTTGTVIESGNAIEASFGTGCWAYMATVSIAPGYPVNINVVAEDRPGGTAVQNVPLTIP